MRPGQPSKLNVFQRLVRRWEDLHPYNGGQAVRLAGVTRADAERAWEKAWTHLRLGTALVEGTRYQRQSTTAPPVQSAVPGEGLEPLFSRQLNHRYRDSDSPLWPVYVPEAGATERQGGWLVLGYRHWVADSVAIRRVLWEWVVRALGRAELSDPTPLSFGGPGYWPLFGPTDAFGGGKWHLLPGLLAGARQSSRMKRVRRLEGPAAREYGVRFTLHELPAGAIHRLHARSKRQGLKVNDVLLGALALAVHDAGVLTETSVRRDLAMGTIADLRGASTQTLTDAFSLYLGFTTAFLRPADLATLDRAARALGRQHAVHRREHAASASSLRMAAGLVAHRLLGLRKTAEFYRKRMPISAGISNVNLAPSPWNRLPGLDGFVRISPTGPLMPVVLSATTLGDRCTLGLTRRTHAVSDEQAGVLTRSLLHTLATYAAG